MKYIKYYKDFAIVSVNTLFALMTIYTDVNGQTNALKNVFLSAEIPSELSKSTNEIKLETYIQLGGISNKRFNHSVPIKTTSNGFTVDFKPINEFSYFSLKQFPIDIWRNLFLMLPGDSLKIKVINNNGYEITTNNPALYNCQLELIQSRITEYSNINVSNSIKSGRKENLDRIAEIIQKYKPYLANNVLELLRLNIVSDINFDYYTGLGLIIQQKDLYSLKDRTVARKDLDQLYFSSDIVTDDFMIRNSSFYGTSLVQLEKIFCGLVSDTTTYKASRFKLMFDSINSRYTGLLKEKLLTIFFIQLFNNSYDAPNILKENLHKITDPLYFKTLSDFLYSKSKGSPAFPFQFLSEAGKVYGLNDFKNKLIICKFWFNGCSGCAQLENELEPIRRKYLNNSEVVFLSINVDNSKDSWKKGLAKNIYSSEGEINLFTNGLGIHHPLIEFYGYSSYPQMLLIDKTGKIISSSPVRPVDKKSLQLFDLLISNSL